MWQTPKKEDIKRGVVLFGSSMQRNGGAFAGHTILRVDGNDATLARPMAWACEHYDSKQPMISCEVYSISIDRLCDETVSSFQVWISRDGPVKMMT